jgi:hypothetical protein
MAKFIAFAVDTNGTALARYNLAATEKEAAEQRQKVLSKHRRRSRHLLDFLGGASVPIPSDTGDDCHHDITGLSDKQLRGFLESSSIPDCHICAPVIGARQLERGDLLSNP